MTTTKRSWFATAIGIDAPADAVGKARQGTAHDEDQHRVDKVIECLLRRFILMQNQSCLRFSKLRAVSNHYYKECTFINTIVGCHNQVLARRFPYYRTC